MDTSDDEIKRAWVERVLGMRFPDAAAPPGRISPTIAFTQSRLLWDAARKTLRADLGRLESAVLAETADEPDAAAIADGVGMVYSVLDVLDERLIDTLDDALNAADPAVRRALQTDARNIVDEYLDFLAHDELMRDIDDNGFVDLGLREGIAAQLNAITRNLKALGA